MMQRFIAYLKQRKEKKSFKEKAQDLTIAPITKSDKNELEKKMHLEKHTIDLKEKDKVLVEEDISFNVSENSTVKENDQSNTSNTEHIELHPIAEQKKSDWFIVGGSAIGKSHIKDKKPCQDYFFFETILNDWGIAVCCDGAGSAANSHIGSKHVASQLAPAYFKEQIVKNNWHINNTLPSNEEWNLIAYEGLKEIHNSLNEFAIKEKLKPNSLACTAIILIYSPAGILVTHIGDGRAGYCNEEGNWEAILTPHKGEEANQTIFITSDGWLSSDLKMSGVHVPESRVITEKPKAFTLLSDGCELHSFKCSVMDEGKNKWHDPNEPYSKFFNPLLENLKLMEENNISEIEANEKWKNFLSAGTEGLENEPDDKTMILGKLI